MVSQFLVNRSTPPPPLPDEIILPSGEVRVHNGRGRYVRGYSAWDVLNGGYMPVTIEQFATVAELRGYLRELKRQYWDSEQTIIIHTPLHQFTRKNLRAYDMVYFEVLETASHVSAGVVQ